MLDAEHWKIVPKVYAQHPISALSLAHQLIAIKAISPARTQRYTGRHRLAIGCAISLDALYMGETLTSEQVQNEAVAAMGSELGEVLILLRDQIA
jgi:hypothetical protein